MGHLDERRMQALCGGQRNASQLFFGLRQTSQQAVVSPAVIKQVDLPIRHAEVHQAASTTAQRESTARACHFGLHANGTHSGRTSAHLATREASLIHLHADEGVQTSACARNELPHAPPAQPIVSPSTKADDLLQRVVGRPGDGKHLIAWAKDAVQGACDRVRPGEALHAHKRGLGAEELRVDGIERLAANVALAVPVDSSKVVGANLLLSKCLQDLIRRRNPCKCIESPLPRSLHLHPLFTVARAFHATHYDFFDSSSCTSFEQECGWRTLCVDGTLSSDRYSRKLGVRPRLHDRVAPLDHNQLIS
eukprot:2122805-Pleurochrysis_carterae.AAC.1